MGSALGELAIIVVGVAIALAFNSWNQRRAEAEELSDYLARLVTDLEADSATYQLVIGVLDRKDAALDEVAEVALGLTEGNADSSLFQSLTITGGMGFHTPGTQRVTFDDLLATGNLRLIRNPELRTRLIAYYDATDEMWLRIDRRRTGYPQAMYRLNPQRWARPPFESVFSGVAAQAIDSLQTPELVNLLNAERTLSEFQRQMMQQSLGLVLDLLTKMRAR